jgi:O-antigen/teichoic acid export membrane protein
MAENNISENSRRIARNTVLLYFRMFLLMAVGLFASRVILRALGENELGIYSTVAGVVTMFSILTGSMSSAISRFITFELGKKEKDLQKVFSTAVAIQFILAAIIVVLAEPAGLWYISHKMVLPPDRIAAAQWVLQFTILSFIIQLVSVPYNADIIAHERMDAFAWISIFEALGKLAVAFAIMISPIDKLIFYAAMLAIVSLLTRMAYAVFCKRHFEESRAGVHLDRTTFRSMFSFAGWNFIGAGSGVLRDQGGNLLLNAFFGPIANAAWFFANQVNGAVQKFVTSFTTALNPQITKSYASGDREYMMRLIFRGSRLSIWLLLLVVYPIIFNAGFLVDLWLGASQAPENTVVFIRLVLIYIMIEAVSYTMVTAMLSTGNIRNYQLLVGGLQLLNLPVDYILLRMGAPAEVIYYVAGAVAILCLSARLFMLRKMIALPVGRFLREVLSRELVVAGLALIVPLLLSRSTLEGWGGFLLSVLATEISSCAIIWFIGYDHDEKDIILHKLLRR